MGLPEPTTRSPGKLVLIYQANGNQHLTGVRYLHDVTLPTDAEALSDATALANVVKAMIPSTSSITGYRITDPLGATIIEGSFATAIVGTSTSDTPLWDSKTITMTGKGTPIVAGERAGQTRMAVYTTGAFPIAPGQKVYDVASSVPLAALRTHLLASDRYWADYYGQKAIVRGVAPVQFNAHAQRKLGS